MDNKTEKRLKLLRERKERLENAAKQLAVNDRTPRNVFPEEPYDIFLKFLENEINTIYTFEVSNIILHLLNDPSLPIKEGEIVKILDSFDKENGYCLIVAEEKVSFHRIYGETGYKEIRKKVSLDEKLKEFREDILKGMRAEEAYNNLEKQGYVDYYS